ncbi:Subtilisin NAT [Fusarium austroafricanum]|uniref:Subtilisin NAT n=1 Tax=Fusarium austroafricanum TaxID=2364996 RepID=A0A8H4KUW0_9HYPO|nr:Subtilisin NAT [Fusarium austroafricanum]
MSVRKVAYECAQILAQTKSNRSLSPDTRLGLENIAFRLKVWAGNMGVFAPGNASIEYRLRDDNDVMEALLSMLVSFKGHIQQAINPPLQEEDEEWEEEDELNPSTSLQSSGSSTSSLTLDSDGSEEQGDMTNDASAPMGSVEKANGVINHLYRLAAVVRKPVSSTENLRVRDFISKQLSKGETQELEDAEDHARCHMQARFPKAPQVLVERLVAAVVLRRMKLRYRQRHELKLQQGVELSFNGALFDSPSIPAGAIADGLACTTSDLPAIQKDDRGVQALQRNSGGKRDGHSITYSATNASSINKARFANYARSTALSGITQGATARRQNLDVPLPPRGFGDVLGKVKCPYCMRLVSKEEMVEPRWTRHILKDIDPYICLFEDCKQGDTLFHSIDDWESHMQWKHTLLWSCQVPGHESYIYDSQIGIQEHIENMHPGSFTNGQLPKIVEQSAFPAPDTFMLLSLSFGTTEAIGTAGDTSALCPICQDHPGPSDKPKNKTEDVQDMRSHIIGHLESIALISLPESELQEENESNVKLSSKDSKAAVGEFNDQNSGSIYGELSTSSQIPDSEYNTHMNPSPPLLPDDQEEHWARVLDQTWMPVRSEDPLLIQWKEQAKISGDLLEKEPSSVDISSRSHHSNDHEGSAMKDREQPIDEHTEESLPVIEQALPNVIHGEEVEASTTQNETIAAAAAVARAEVSAFIAQEEEEMSALQAKKMRKGKLMLKDTRRYSELLENRIARDARSEATAAIAVEEEEIIALKAKKTRVGNLDHNDTYRYNYLLENKVTKSSQAKVAAKIAAEEAELADLEAKKARRGKLEKKEIDRIEQLLEIKSAREDRGAGEQAAKEAEMRTTWEAERLAAQKAEERKAVETEERGAQGFEAASDRNKRGSWIHSAGRFKILLEKYPSDTCKPIKIALVDEGVDASFSDLGVSIAAGRSFSASSNASEVMKPWYTSSRGRGTMMAAVISTICPKPQLYIAKLEEELGGNVPCMNARSATQAVNWAIAHEVDIISMNWSIRGDATEINALKNALMSAANKNILMFCSAVEQGPSEEDRWFPAQFAECFKIGEASPGGYQLRWVDYDAIDYLFPGQSLIFKDSSGTEKKIDGSALATACAAGFAGALLYSGQVLLAISGWKIDLRKRPRLKAVLDRASDDENFIDVKREIEEGLKHCIRHILTREKGATFMLDSRGNPATAFPPYQDSGPSIEGLNWDAITIDAFTKLMRNLTGG